MRNATISPESKLGDGVKQAGLSALASIRLLARCISCYTQLRREYDELERLSYRSLRDIGLTPNDVAFMTRRPIWRRCWRSVRSCPNKRCRGSSVCIADCRATRTPFSGPDEITTSDTAIK
jgi:uncharacterized protein YjiS (DUF1127 family)